MSEPYERQDNPFPIGTVAWSKFESEQDRLEKADRSTRLLTGELEPQNEQDKRYIQDMGGVKGLKAGWPKKWCVCRKCGSEWQATGFPMPLPNPKNPAFILFRKSPLRHGNWLFPGICNVCDDELHAVAPPPARIIETKSKKKNIPYAD